MAIAAIAIGTFSCKDEEEKKAKTTAELIQGTWKETRTDSAGPNSNTWVNITNIPACEQDNRTVITSNTLKNAIGSIKCDPDEADMTYPYRILTNPNRIETEIQVNLGSLLITVKDTATLESVSESQIVLIQKSSELEGARLKTTFTK